MMRRIADLREANSQDAAELARLQAETAKLKARIQCQGRCIAAHIAVLGSTATELDAGVQRQRTRIAELTAAMRSLLTAHLCHEDECANLERVEAGLRHAQQLLMRWEAQSTAVKAWRAWLAALAASMRHDDQSWVVSPSWSPWTGRAPPAIPLTVQGVVQRK
jgi:hypothetical protein